MHDQLQESINALFQSQECRPDETEMDKAYREQDQNQLKIDSEKARRELEEKWIQQKAEIEKVRIESEKEIARIFADIRERQIEQDEKFNRLLWDLESQWQVFRAQMQEQRDKRLRSHQELAGYLRKLPDAIIEYQQDEMAS